MSTSTASSSGVGGTPSNPWDMDVTRRLLQQRIDSGEITSADVDLFRRGYRWIMLSTGLGALAGLPVWWAMSRRRPPPSLASKLATSFFLSSTGSFLGFTVGGAAAALEVNNNMQDSRRKVKVFEEVMMQSKRIAEDRRAGRPISLPEVGSGSGMDGDGSVEGSWQSSSSAVAPGDDGPRSLGIREGEFPTQVKSIRAANKVSDRSTRYLSAIPAIFYPPCALCRSPQCLWIRRRIRLGPSTQGRAAASFQFRRLPRLLPCVRKRRSVNESEQFSRPAAAAAAAQALPGGSRARGFRKVDHDVIRVIDRVQAGGI